MPCDSVRTIKTDLRKSNWDRLALVFQEDGWRVMRASDDTYMFVEKRSTTGQWFRIYKNSDNIEHNFYGRNQAEEAMSRFKRLYAAKTLTEGAKRYGMKVLERKETEKNTIRLRLGK